MPVQYITSSESDFSAGIDARSAENQIAPGFVKDLLNADIVEKRSRTRPGYQGFAGNLPVRVTQLDYDDSTNQVCFTLDSSVSLDTNVNLEVVRSSPLVVYGRSSSFESGDGPFDNSQDRAKYYSSFSIPLRKLFLAPSGTLTIEGSEHGLGTTNMFVDFVESTSLSNRSYTYILPNSISIDESAFDINTTYTVSQDKQVFAFFSDKSTGGGNNFVQHLVHDGSPESQTFTITSATHVLANFNIIPQVQVDNGTSRERVVPESFLVHPNGDVDITLINGTGGSLDYYVILSAAPITNVISGNSPSTSSSTITISNPTRPWVFFGIYLEQTPGGILELVYPNSIDFDDVSGEFTLSFDNESTVARNFIVYYEYGDLRSNQLCVQDSSVTVSGTDEIPQLTIWGLDHNEIYSVDKSFREGWVTHIDSYRRSGEQRLVSGLGGNLFSARTNEEVGETYLLPTLYPNIVTRTSGQRVLGPLFWDSFDAPARTRGYITSSNSGTNWAKVTAVEYDTNNTWTKYTVSLPNKAILDSTGSPTSLSSVISVTSGLEDWLTVEGMSYARHDGTFKIRQIQDSTDSIFIWVSNNDNSSDYNDTDTGGQCGVFTDQFQWLTDSPYIPQDTLASSALADNFVCTVLSSDGDLTVTDGFLDRIEVAAGILFNGIRTSSVIPLRTENPNAVESVENLVRGDMISYTEIDRLLRILYINSGTDLGIDITVTNGVATAILQSGDTTYLTEGRNILLTQAGVHTGVHTVLEILSTTEFSWETEETDSVSDALLLGTTIQVDEELLYKDTQGDQVGFAVEERWIPIEAPDDSFDLTPSTHVRYLDSFPYGLQPFLRSTMIQDGMYLTNYDDEVYKFDGTSMYRSGVIPWQPGAFLTQETSGATIVTNLRSVAYSAISAAEGKLTVDPAVQQSIPTGSSVRLSGSSLTYTIRDVSDDGTDFFLLMDRSLDSDVSATGTVSEIGTFRYYYRLNAVDANDNVVASAVTGYQDHVVEMTGNAAVQHKLIGLPAWDVYDYDRLEVQIYRTKMNQAAPFYRVTTLPLDFDNTQGYVLYRDSFADTDLSNLDEVNTSLKGTELGIGWTDNLRSKYVTSIGNRLIQGNLRDYPELDIQIVADATVSNSDYDGDSFLFRRDNADALTATNMSDRVTYEWVDGPTGTISSFAVGSDQFSFDTSSPTGANTGDWIYLTYATVDTTGRDLTYSGWWQIASVATNTVTINLVGAASVTDYPDSYAVASDPSDVPVLLGEDGNLGMVNGDSFDTFDAMRRMSMAINASMRQVDISLTGMEGFTPWLIARSGNDTPPAGRLIVRQPRSDEDTFELVPTFSGYNLFINSVKRTSGSSISASTAIFPSRILVSYENYPEIYDSPSVVIDSESDSAIDVNPADGQEITGIIPFFGEAAFGAAQQSAILVVFKTNSIYLVDINQKLQGLNPVQRIETEGLGCTAPYSIASTKGGIMFANESGMYCLRRNQAIDYIGKYMERNWTERVDLSSLGLAQGHHYGVGRVYKLSVPLVQDITSTGYLAPSEAYVYNHTAESDGRMGAWARYDNHPATGWANLAQNAYFGSSTGRVFSIRNTGDVQDSRDDNQAIHYQVDLRANDYGNPGIRKILDSIVAHYRVSERSTGITLSYSVDLDQEYTETTPIIVPKPGAEDNLSDSVAQDIVSIRHNVGRRRGVYFQIRVENNTIDESVELAGVDYKIGGATEKGILQAKGTQSK